MHGLPKMCFNMLMNNLSGDIWYSGLGILGTTNDEIIYELGKIYTPNIDVVEQKFVSYLDELVTNYRLPKKFCDTVDARFKLHTFNYDPVLREKYYDAVFSTYEIRNSEIRDEKNLDMLIAKYAILPDEIISLEFKDKFVKYNVMLRSARESENRLLEEIRAYYDASDELKKSLELNKERAYAHLRERESADEIYDLIIQNTLLHLEKGVSNYRIALCGPNINLGNKDNNSRNKYISNDDISNDDDNSKKPK